MAETRGVDVLLMVFVLVQLDGSDVGIGIFFGQMVLSNCFCMAVVMEYSSTDGKW